MRSRWRCQGRRRARTVVLAALLLAGATACGSRATPGADGAGARPASGRLVPGRHDCELAADC